MNSSEEDHWLAVISAVLFVIIAFVAIPAGFLTLRDWIALRLKKRKSQIRGFEVKPNTDLKSVPETKEVEDRT